MPASFLTAEWRNLVMLNYEVDPEILLPRVPAGTVLDTWNGKAFVSMVGFLFLRTRVKGIPIPFHINFEEINLRFYVRRETAEEVRRGVVFVKEIVPQKAIAWVARRFYNENYVAMPTGHLVRLPEGEQGTGEVGYEWRSGNRWNRLSAKIAGAPALAPTDSEEEFITEHYWGYARQPDNSTVEYQVEHPRWNVWGATDSTFDCDIPALYGSEFGEYLSAAPHSAFVADGSAIIVRKGTRLAGNVG